ncbi:MAG TPA: hypothetical protein VJT84_06965 [Gaiellaceae bacterium]|nr:hypothetical protein [Gaiellaceae bacterium]
MLSTGAAALAADAPPWSGGAAVETPFERFAAGLASTVADAPVTVSCNNRTAWRTLAAQRRVDANKAWGFVLFDRDAAGARPRPRMELAEAACFYLEQYLRLPPAQKGKSCRITTVTVAGGRTDRRRSSYGECPNYRRRVVALQTLAHESQHLAGIRDEGLAECNGMQTLAWFAERFGATHAQGVRMARDYYRDDYLTLRPGTPYYLADCPEPD